MTPRPYYDHAGITIYHGDCRDILPTLGGCGDFILTDPPYGIAYDASHRKYHNGIAREPATWDTEAYDPTPLLRLGLPAIIWGANCFASRLPDGTAWIAWVKIARQDADIRQSDCELAWTNCLHRSRVFQHLWIGAYRESEAGMTNYHPTQKPLALMKWCLHIARVDGVVLDPYCGSGTTLLAARECGLHAIGVEREERYCAIAAERLRQEVLPFRQESLSFEPEIVEHLFVDTG